jgi:hypothetical protein
MGITVRVKSVKKFRIRFRKVCYNMFKKAIVFRFVGMEVIYPLNIKG